MDKKNTLWCADGAYCEVPQKGIALSNKALLIREGGDENHYLQFDGGIDGPKLNGYGGGLLSAKGKPQLMWNDGGVNVNKLVVGGVPFDPRRIDELEQRLNALTANAPQAAQVEAAQKIAAQAVQAAQAAQVEAAQKIAAQAAQVEAAQKIAAQAVEQWRIYTDGNNSFIVARPYGNIFECMSPDGVNCNWWGSIEDAEKNLRNPPAVINPVRAGWALKEVRELPKVRGRFITVRRIDNKKTPLNINQIIAYKGSQPIKPVGASLSPPYPGGQFPAENVITGQGGFAHTDSSENAFMTIDLGDTYEIDAIEIINRGDCCQDRMIGTRLEVQSGPETYIIAQIKDTQQKYRFENIKVGWVVVQKSDFPGNDFAGGVVGTPSEIMEVCDKNPACQGFAYGISGGVQGKAWLKNKLENPVQNEIADMYIHGPRFLAARAQAPKKPTRVFEGFQWKGTNRCIDVVNGETKAGTKVHLWDCDSNNDAQNFMIEPSGEIKLRKDPTKCLDIPSADMRNGNVMQIWDCNGTAAQNFIMEDGSIKVRANKGFALDVSGGVNANGTPIHLWTYDVNNNNQKFDTIRQEWDQ
jgi:hypothetical protein